MKNVRLKYFLLACVFLLFLIAPFTLSFFFSSSTNGTIKVDKTIEADFINSSKKHILIFFGYVGCADVCTPALEKLNELYESEEFSAIKDSTDIIFVNLTPKIEASQANAFAKSFNQQFKGIYLSNKEILSIDRTFGLYFAKKLSKKNEINHTDYLYLIQNNKDSKILKTIYSIHPLHIKNVSNDIIKLRMKGNDEYTD